MSCLNLQRCLVIGFLVWACLVIAGCSTAGALTGLIGSKPEISAQAGAENTKQTVGINGKVDQSAKADTTIKDSQVGKVDTSNGKKVSTSSIKADTITADKIEIRNEEGGIAWIAGVIACFVSLSAGVWIGNRISRNDKGA